MNELLNVLLVEDSEDDALLLIRALHRGGFQVVWERVQTAEALRAALAACVWDVVVSDYRLPRLAAPQALAIVQQSQLDVPFIVVSGTIGEQLAVDLMKAGAHDYLMKGYLTRLPEVIRRELREVKRREAQRHAEAMLKLQRAAIEAAIDGIAIRQQDTFLYVNPAYVSLFGYHSPDELIGKTWQMLYSPEEVQRFEQRVMPMVERDRAWQGQAIATRKDGSTFSQGASLTLTDGGLMISVCRDNSALKEAQDQLTHNVYHDPLTGLPNRKLLTERLELCIQRLMRVDDYGYAVLFLDLDRFKVINDSLGHVVGDQLLIAIAKKLKAHLRDMDLVVRLGSDEFVVLLEEIRDLNAIVQIAERILADYHAPLMINGHEIFTSLSMGIVVGSQVYDYPSELIRDADIAMYRAKAQRTNSYTFFDAGMYAQAKNRLDLEMDLRNALKRQEFVLYYQPIVDLRTQKIAGFEALVRWHHPRRGFIAPDEFIPIAEETGFITALDSWVFVTACQQMSAWKQQYAEHFPLKISINLSVQDLRKADFLSDVDDVLCRTHLTGEEITFEITESMLIDDINWVIGLLIQLDARQIQISIDDFGTGYSSLGYLHRLPVDNLKIDRSFVSQLQWGNREYHVVDTIITLSKKLGQAAIAEGIETAHQCQALKQLGCELGQGYFFAKPLSPQEVEQRYFQTQLPTMPTLNCAQVHEADRHANCHT